MSVDVKRKITNGIVVQDFNPKTQELISQEFIASSSVDYEDGRGNTIEPFEECAPFSMVQSVNSESVNHIVGEPVTVAELIQYLKGYNPDTKMVGLFWQEDDIRSMHKDDNDINELDEDFEGTPLTDKQVTNILTDLSRNHNCEYGVTWDTISDSIDYHTKD